MYTCHSSIAPRHEGFVCVLEEIKFMCTEQIIVMVILLGWPIYLLYDLRKNWKQAGMDLY